MHASCPLVSVIMCVFNTRKDYLLAACISILNQTYKNLELIIVDDCSTKNLFDDPIFIDNRIVLLRNNENRGAAFSRNRALEIAKGKYIAIMDSDDISLPERLEKQVNFMETKNDVVACGTWFKFIGNKNHEVHRNIDDNEYYRCCLLFDNVPTILNSSAMIRKTVLDKYKIKYNENLWFAEDYQMWVDLAEKGILTNLKETLVYYRVHNQQLTHNNEKRAKTITFGSIVKKRQLTKMNSTLSEDDISFFSEFFFLSKSVKLSRYANILAHIRDDNMISNYFCPKKLSLRIDEQWRAKVMSINNPLVLLCEELKIKDKQFKNIFRIKIDQLKIKCFKKK